jgi:hypothetical protein
MADGLANIISLPVTAAFTGLAENVNAKMDAITNATAKAFEVFPRFFNCFTHHRLES